MLNKRGRRKEEEKKMEGKGKRVKMQGRRMRKRNAILKRQDKRENYNEKVQIA
jgi:hypothetical protein